MFSIQIMFRKLSIIMMPGNDIYQGKKKIPPYGGTFFIISLLAKSNFVSLFAAG